MAFASSSSIFGAKSGAPSVFGNPGNPSLAAAPPLGQQTNNQSNTFGPTQSQPTGNLFGQPQQQQSGNPLFGQPQQQQSSNPLFGQPQQQQQSGNPLFGQPQQQQIGGGLFVQPQQQPQQQAPNIFGQSNQQPSAPGDSLFSQPQQSQQQQPAFGGSGGFSAPGGQLFGIKTQQPQQQQQLGFATTQASASPLFTKSTKFNDLPDDIKRVLEAIDSHIQGRAQISKELHQRKLGEEPTKGQSLIKELHKELAEISTTIRTDAHFTQDLKARVDQSVEDTIVATRIVDGFRNPQSGNTYLKDHAGFPLEYFTRITDQMQQRLMWYKTTIEQIDRKLSSSSAQAQTPQGISATLQAQHATFLALASKTAALDAEVQKIKALYTQLWRTKTGSVRDPFNDAVKATEPADFGIGSLNLR